VDVKELQLFYDMARKLFKDDDVQVVAAKERLDESRAMANDRKPLAKRISTMEFKITKARKNKEKADEEVRQTENAIVDLQATLGKQQALVLSRKADLDALESELKSLLNHAAVEEPAAPELPQELAGDQEVQEAFANAKAAAESAQKLLASKLKEKAATAAPTLEQPLDEWMAGLDGENQEFAKSQRASMGDENLLQIMSLLKGKGRPVRAGPYG